MWFILLFTFLILYGVYLKLKYFTLRGTLPGLAPQFLFGNLLQTGLLRGATLPEVFTSLTKQFGDIFQLQLGFLRFVVVGNIDDIQHIYTNRNIYEQGEIGTQNLGVLLPSGLITLTGFTYKRHKSIIRPLFRRNNIISNFNLILDCTDKLLDNWRSFPVDHIHCDITTQFGNLSLQIFGLIAFDYDFETLNQTSSSELLEALQSFHIEMKRSLYLPILLLRVYLKLNFVYRRNRAIIQRYIYQMMEKELKETTESRAERKKKSLIASLVASLRSDEESDLNISEETKTGLSRNEILDEILMFIIAGFETTTTTLTWAIHLLSKHPPVQQKIKSELRENNVNQLLTIERLDALTYLECLIKEILRFSQIADGSYRTVIAEDHLPSSGVQLHKGDHVVAPFSILSHDRRYWSIDPDIFHPERFLNEDKDHHPYAFLPFGGGHRQCIGQDLARFELKVILARLMQHVTFGDGGPNVNSGGFKQGVIIMLKHVGVTIIFDQ